jgi:hypothetical protein
LDISSGVRRGPPVADLSLCPCYHYYPADVSFPVSFRSQREIFVEVSLSPFKVGNERLVIAFIVDITIKKEKEKAEKEYELPFYINGLMNLKYS